MGDSPRVSVITATYNWSSVLRYAIESVLWQSFSDFEMLVIGDGCTDDSEEVVASFGDPRVRWHNLPENTGHQSAPNNTGLAMARGEFIAYLGHDDLWYPTHLETMVKALEESGADLAYCWLEMIWPPQTGLRLITGFTPSGEFEPDLILSPGSVMHRRALWQEIGDWVDYRSTARSPDAEFLERAFRRGKKFVEVKSLSVIKFNASARPDCYIEKASHEQEECARRIKSEPDFIERELMAVIESSMRRHPEDISRGNPPPDAPPGVGMMSSRVMRGAAAPEIPEPQYPAAPEGRIDFASPEAERFLWHGWSYPEPTFRWSDGRKAGLSFSLSEPRALQLTVKWAPFLADNRIQVQPVDVFLNDQFLDLRRLSNFEMQVDHFDLPARMLRDRNTLTFKFPNSTSPITLGVSRDVRRLAVCVEWIEFHPII